VLHQYRCCHFTTNPVSPPQHELVKFELETCGLKIFTAKLALVAKACAQRSADDARQNHPSVIRVNACCQIYFKSGPKGRES